MTKKKKASSRTKSSLEFPLEVLKAKEDFKKRKNKHFPIMQKLTESTDLDTLKKMWISLEKAEIKERKKRKDTRNFTDDLWPHFFVGMVSAYTTMPPYYYQTKSQRKKLLEELKKYSGQLTKKLQRNRLDYKLAHSDKHKILDFYERLDFLDNWKADKSGAEKPRISEVLQRLICVVEQDLNSSKNLRTDAHTEARQFVYHLAQHLKRAYGTPMNSVLLAATAAIYGVEYTEADIRKILKRPGRR